jgi:hypothetical protein
MLYGNKSISGRQRPPPENHEKGSRDQNPKTEKTKIVVHNLHLTVQ